MDLNGNTHMSQFKAKDIIQCLFTVTFIYDSLPHYVGNIYQVKEGEEAYYNYWKDHYMLLKRDGVMTDEALKLGISDAIPL